MRKNYSGRAARHIRRLHRMYLDYPTDVLQRTVSEALQYGLLDLERIERKLLRHMAGEFFRIPTDPDKDDEKP